MSLLTEDFRTIVLNNIPLLDVRAPVEFVQGSFLNAVNLPILSDEERRLVGIKYKQEGNNQAIKLAEELIQQVGKKERVLLWKKFIKDNPNAYLYCFRGGQRSSISQEWLKEEDINITRLKGGYKKFRNFLIKESERISSELKTIILGGRTGSGKTLLLSQLDNFIDLEGLANHKGSTFGNCILSQPSQINFENNLAYKLIQFESKPFNNLVIEHESHNIGKAFIPKIVFKNLMNGQLVILETPLEERINITCHEYVELAIKEHIKVFGADGFEVWKDGVFKSLDKIQNRLGSEFYLELKSMFTLATEKYILNGDISLYKKWIEILLINYYDPMYEYQLTKTKIPVIFRGNTKEVLAFIASKEEAV